MRQHYNLDHLIDYATEEVSATTRVVNPLYRKIDGEVRKAMGKLNRKRKQFGALMLNDEIEPGRVEKYQQAKADLYEEILPISYRVCGGFQQIPGKRSCSRTGNLLAIASMYV